MRDSILKRTAKFFGRLAKRRGEEQKPQPAAAAEQKKDAFTPEEARFIFYFLQDLLVSLILSRDDSFDLERLRTYNPEIFWKLLGFGVEMDRLDRPVGADRFQCFLREYWETFGEAFAEYKKYSREVHHG